jgi:hypothetical protein
VWEPGSEHPVTPQICRSLGFGTDPNDSAPTRVRGIVHDSGVLASY